MKSWGLAIVMAGIIHASCAPKQQGPEVRVVPTIVRESGGGLKSAVYGFALPAQGTIAEGEVAVPFSHTIQGQLSVVTSERIRVDVGGYNPRAGPNQQTCDHDVADKVRTLKSEIRVSCATVRFALHQVAGEIVSASASVYLPQLKSVARGPCREYRIDAKGGPGVCLAYEQRPLIQSQWSSYQAVSLSKRND